MTTIAELYHGYTIFECDNGYYATDNFRTIPTRLSLRTIKEEIDLWNRIDGLID